MLSVVATCRHYPCLPHAHGLLPLMGGSRYYSVTVGLLSYIIKNTWDLPWLGSQHFGFHWGRLNRGLPQAMADMMVENASGIADEEPFPKLLVHQCTCRYHWNLKSSLSHHCQLRGSLMYCQKHHRCHHHSRQWLVLQAQLYHYEGWCSCGRVMTWELGYATVSKLNVPMEMSGDISSWLWFCQAPWLIWQEYWAIYCQSQ